MSCFDKTDPNALALSSRLFRGTVSDATAIYGRIAENVRYRRDFSATHKIVVCYLIKRAVSFAEHCRSLTICAKALAYAFETTDLDQLALEYEIPRVVKERWPGSHVIEYWPDSKVTFEPSNMNKATRTVLENDLHRLLQETNTNYYIQGCVVSGLIPRTKWILSQLIIDWYEACKRDNLIGCMLVLARVRGFSGLILQTLYGYLNE